MADYDRIGNISSPTSLSLSLSLSLSVSVSVSRLIFSSSHRELGSHWSSGGRLQQERAGAEALERDGGEPQTSYRSLACSQGMFSIFS